MEDPTAAGYAWWRSASDSNPYATDHGIYRRAGMTPLLGRFTVDATWTSALEHAAGPPDYWGSSLKGSWVQIRRPDIGIRPLIKANRQVSVHSSV